MASGSKGGNRRRRAPGSGYAREEKNGTWTALYPKPGHATGYHVKRGFASEAAAARWLADLATRETERYDIAGGEQTLDKLIDRWLDRQEEKVKASKLKQRSWNDYDFKLGYARDLLGERRISELMPDHIDDALAIMGRALAETTTRQIRALLHRILEDARHRRYIASNPVIVERGIAAARKAPKRLNMAETRAVLKAAQGNFYELAWWLILTLGLRAGEVCGLRKGDIDLQARTVRIEATVADMRGTPALSTPKTKAGVRVLPLPAALVPMVEEHLLWLDRRAVDARKKRLLYDSGPQRNVAHKHEPPQWHEHNLLFPGKSGKPFNTTSLYHQLQRLCKAGKVVPTKVHDLRHTAAALYASVGTPEPTIAAILGHASTITGHYAAHDIETLRGWAEQVYGAIEGEQEKQRRTG